MSFPLTTLIIYSIVLIVLVLIAIPLFNTRNFTADIDRTLHYVCIGIVLALLLLLMSPMLYKILLSGHEVYTTSYKQFP